VIGVGGMGSVYRARDLHFPGVVKLVAVKELLNQAPDPIVREAIIHNFEREANILVTLNHSSIPKIFDYFQSMRIISCIGIHQRERFGSINA